MTAAACPPTDWAEIVEAAVRAAKAGDPQARLFLAKYLLGTPSARASSLLTIIAEDEAGLDPVQQAVTTANAAKLLQF